MIQELHTVGIYQREMKADVQRKTTIQKHFYTNCYDNFIYNSPNQKQLRYPPTDKWINKLVSILQNTTKQIKKIKNSKLQAYKWISKALC